MIVIGEKLNSSILKTQTAINSRDVEFLTDLINKQIICGADYLDINTAVGVESEMENMLWLAKLVIEQTKKGIMLDSPSAKVILKVIPLIQDRPLIINSVTLNERSEILPVIRDFGAWVVGLPIDEKGIPSTAAIRAENAERLTEKIVRVGISIDKIFIDILAEPIAMNDKNLINTLETIILIKKLLPDVKTICGVSNVSFGLPKRININCAFLSAAIIAGLDAAILDITSDMLKSTLLSALAIAGKDEYCLSYISNMK